MKTNRVVVVTNIENGTIHVYTSFKKMYINNPDLVPYKNQILYLFSIKKVRMANIVTDENEYVIERLYLNR